MNRYRPRQLHSLDPAAIVLRFAFALPSFDNTDDGAAGAGGEGPGSSGDKKPKEKTFTQAEVNQIVADRLKRERSGGMSDEDAAELQRLKDAEKERERKDKERKGQYEALTQSLKDDHAKKETGWNAERDTLLGDLKKDRCEGKIIAAAAAKSDYPKQIAQLLGPRVTLDKDREVVCLDEDGQVMYEAGKKVEPERLVEMWLELPENRHFLRSQMATDGTDKTEDGKGAAKPSTTGSGRQSSGNKEIDAAKKKWDDARVLAQKTGRQEDIMASFQAKRAYEQLTKDAAK